MPDHFKHHLEWDSAKAIRNRHKHGVGFEVAATVFLDSLALSRFDDEHSETEVRWITLVRASNNALLVVIHTWQDIDEHNAGIRIISARSATKREQRDYEGKA